jgi:subfamily B ATP-binding cassette protein MsbA
MQMSDANAAAAQAGNETARGEAVATDVATVRARDPQRLVSAVHDIRAWRLFYGIARDQLWFLPAIIVLALLTSLFEGVGLTLVIPLVQSLGQDGGPYISRGYLGFLEKFIGSIPSADRTATVLGLMFAAILAKSVISYANMTLLGLVYGRISHRLRTAIFNRIVSIPLATLERQESGTLLNTLSNETWRVTDAVNHIYAIITSASTAVVFIALLVVLDWKKALLAIACLSLIPPVVNLVSRRAKALSRVALETNEALAQQTWSTINGLRTIHTFGREAYEQERFNAISDRVRNLFLKMALVSMSSGPITEIMATGIIALLVLLVSGDTGGMATLVAFVAILYRLQPRLMALLSGQTELASLDASITVVAELLRGEREPRVCNELRPVIEGPISFRNVTFRYPDASVPAVQDFSFEFPSIGIIAIVGASGAGKSTLLDLILGFQVPESGEIRVGGLKLTEAVAPAWRQRTGVVSQDPYVFDDTVRANIVYGRPDASDAEVFRAAQAVAADKFIQMLPQAYDTRIGERAVSLSGGQRQRLALARAFLRDPDLLLLDEATNALDPSTEAEFQATLKKFASNRAVVVVAHRFSTVEIADHVIVLQNGQIAEQGRPATLARSNGLFAEMFGAAYSKRTERSLAEGPIPA